MPRANEHNVQITISNKLGFHVRPVQRFAELARIFRSDVQVELKGRRAPGKSVMNLMSLGGRCGDAMSIRALGEDARQCVEVLRFLAESNFFVEDDLEPGTCSQRHVERLAHIASCFNSTVEATADGRTADAKDLSGLLELGLTASCQPKFQIEGDDAEQARAVINNLVGHCFYVEEQMVKKAKKGD